MLSATDANNLRGAFTTAIDALGVPATWTQAKPPADTKNITVGFRTAGKDDQEIVAAYGIAAKIITMKAADFTTDPEKFDSLLIMNERYTLDAVMPVHLNGAIIGYKAYARGK